MAARFDGIDDYIQLPNRFIQAGALSVCTNVMYNTFNQWSRIFDWGNGEWNNNILLANEGEKEGRVCVWCFSNCN